MGDAGPQVKSRRYGECTTEGGSKSMCKGEGRARAVKNILCSSRGTQFSSYHSPVMSATRIQPTFLTSMSAGTHVAYMCRHIQII